MPLNITIFVFFVDQMIKLLVESTMHVGQSVPVLGKIFSLTYVLNPGAAFGMMEYQRWFFVAIALGVFLVTFIFYKRLQKECKVLRCGIGLLLGGAAGNLADRIKTGLVVDYFDFHIWPVFNFADIAICVGAAIVLFYVWRRQDEHEEKLCS